MALKDPRDLTFAEHLFAVRAQCDVAEEYLREHRFGSARTCLSHAHLHLALAESLVTTRRPGRAPHR